MGRMKDYGIWLEEKGFTKKNNKWMPTKDFCLYSWRVYSDEQERFRKQQAPKPSSGSD